MDKDLFHWSDCAIYNAPAYPVGKCDCGYEDRLRRRHENARLCKECNFGKMRAQKGFVSSGLQQCFHCSANYDLLWARK